MFCNALRTSVKVVRVPTVVPLRTIITCTNHNHYNAVKPIMNQHMYMQRRTFMGPLMRYLTQFVASIGGTSIRAFFQAFQQAAGIYSYSILIISSS